MKNREDWLLRFMDWCDDLGPWGGIVWIFVMTVGIVGGSLLVIFVGSYLATVIGAFI